MAPPIVLCSKCFCDYGVRIEAERLGTVSAEECPNCASDSGRKLNAESLLGLAHRFFVLGSVVRTSYGSAPALQFNDHHHGSHEVNFPGGLDRDARLLEKALHIGFFHYGPRLWMIGEIEPLKALQDESERANILDRIVSEFPSRFLAKDETFLRLRVNPISPTDPSEYDSAPSAYTGKGRLDSVELPVLYGSQDLEICVHECRVTVADDLYIAVLQPNQALRLLDLTGTVKEDVTEFESLSLAIHFLFRAENHSYEIGRAIAVAAFKKGYDGIVYPSYFSQVRAGIIPNVAILGRPIGDGRVKVSGINRLRLEQVSYVTHFGPVGY